MWIKNRDRVLLLLAAVAAATLCAADFSGKVVAITDRDTIRVMHDGAPERIRLWGIDCPESRQAFGTRAKQLTGDLAFGQVVTVEGTSILGCRCTATRLKRCRRIETK